jgi:peptidyl-tRNA hydrolase, PTH2 family
MNEVKQVIVINKGLKMRRGKEIAQGAHASMAWLTTRIRKHPWRRRFSAAEKAWMQGSFRKVTLQTDSADHLQQLYQRAVAAGLEAHLITDAGLTEFHGMPETTALGIGPDYDERIDRITGKLKLY